MIPANVSPVLDHLWQSTAFAGLMAAVAFGLRKNRAAVRFWLWMAASLKFLVPFALLVGLGRLINWRPAPLNLQPAQWTAIQDVGQSVFTPSSAITLTPGAAIHTSGLWWAWLAGLWAAGTLFVAVRWARQWWGVRALVRRAAPVDLGLTIPTVTAPATLEPGVFGVFRPILFLPDGITERMAPEQMRTLVEHELCHVRRRDNLWAALHVAVEAIFWFHPVVWWLGAKMVEEREACCDEAVLRAGAAADVYASIVLEVCRFYAAPPTPAISGITGADLKNRVLAIASGDFGRKLSPASKLLLFGLGCSLLAAPVSAGLLLKSSPVSARSTAPDDVRPLPVPQVQGTPAPAASSGVDVTWTQTSSAEYAVRIGVTLPGGEFVEARQSGKENAQFDFVGQVKDAYGTTVTNLRSFETFKIAGDGAVGPAHVPVFRSDDVKLLPGNYTLKVLARDDDTGRVGTYVKQFTIPSAPAPPLEAPAAPQQQSPPPSFSAVSIKPVGTAPRVPSYQFAFRESPGGLLAMGTTGSTLCGLVRRAYDLQVDQMQGCEDWTGSDLFSIVATTDQPASHEELMAMLRGVLASSFGLQLATKTKEMPVLSLEVQPGGLKLQALGVGEQPSRQPHTMPPGEVYYTQAVQIQGLIGFLNGMGSRRPLGRLVVDGTGLKGNYDIYLTGPGGPTEDGRGDRLDVSLDTIRVSLKRMGLELNEKTDKVDYYSIQSAHPPTPN